MNKCPFCGHDQYYTRDYQYGSVEWKHRFDGETADNTETLDSLNVRYGKIAYCENCNRIVGRAKIVFGKYIMCFNKDG